MENIFHKSTSFCLFVCDCCTDRMFSSHSLHLIFVTFFKIFSQFKLWQSYSQHTSIHPSIQGHISHEAKRLRQYYRLRRERNLLNVSSSQHSQNSSNQQQSERVILVKRVNDAFYRELDMNKLSTLQSQNLSIFSKILAVFCGHETPNASIRIVKNGEVLVCCDDDLRRLKHGDRLEVTFL